ncbi:hypothetical protein HPP92_018284 [Vanilla planifolia]|uniref:FAM192A/Fyv6 N-terminal domain-containing protein n=1 Tax=Vanilla planifolia TaxID=51239 RepID=A0A835UKN6_VANPL|nr:hypothetical protein HPP92_018284 [Vanilla planifolia]
MEDEIAARPIRLVNFVSEETLEQARKTRGERVEDGTAQRDRSLYEILKENKEKKDAEFNERFKHRPPKALDEDETEFYDKLEMSKREYERQIANEEAEQLRSFQEAVAAQSSVVRELMDPSPIAPKPEDEKPATKRAHNSTRASFIISVKPQAKKVKTEDQSSASVKFKDSSTTSNGNKMKSDDRTERTLGGLVSYSDESDED